MGNSLRLIIDDIIGSWPQFIESDLTLGFSKNTPARGIFKYLLELYFIVSERRDIGFYWQIFKFFSKRDSDLFLR